MKIKNIYMSRLDFALNLNRLLLLSGTDKQRAFVQSVVRQVADASGHDKFILIYKSPEWQKQFGTASAAAAVELPDFVPTRATKVALDWKRLTPKIPREEYFMLFQ